MNDNVTRPLSSHVIAHTPHFTPTAFLHPLATRSIPVTTSLTFFLRSSLSIPAQFYNIDRLVCTNIQVRPVSAARGLTTPAASSHNMSRRAGYGAEQSTPQLANTILYINKYTLDHKKAMDSRAMLWTMGRAYHFCILSCTREGRRTRQKNKLRLS